MPKVSVIIPNFNHERFLTQRIESVLNQTFQDFELIILDDCSTDNSRSIIEKFRNHKKVSKIFYNSVNSGSTFRQWEKGIALAAGELIWIAESDDYASPEFLDTLIRPFLNYPEVAISFCRSVNVDENNNIIGLTLHADKLDPVKWTHDYIEDGRVEISKYLKFRNTIPNASAVLFKNPNNLNAVLSTDMRFTGDWLFWKNILKENNNKIAYSQNPLNFFREHSNTTRSIKKSINIDSELKRFREYKTFIPNSLFTAFDGRFRWMMAEWIDRGVCTALRKTHYRYLPELHPALIIRYYVYLIRRFLKKRYFN